MATKLLSKKPRLEITFGFITALIMMLTGGTIMVMDEFLYTNPDLKRIGATVFAGGAFILLVTAVIDLYHKIERLETIIDDNSFPDVSR